uniref:Ricin B lectin domain-containing protein n=1 Tax=Rhizophagus irregularis (strain DAOM 181602 / DAOM 197198 / MUCL 43194) TaxID=747089 RepID=U9TYH0_RHIID
MRQVCLRYCISRSRIRRILQDRVFLFVYNTILKMNVGIYFNIVPKGNDKLSLYFENKNSTLKLHSNKDSDNAQWEVKWLGAENGKDRVVLINKGLGMAMKAEELQEASSIVPSDYGWRVSRHTPEKKKELNLNAWAGGELHDGQDVRLYPYTETYNDLWAFQLVEN